MITINKHLTAAQPIEITAETFPQLFSGNERTRDISIVRTCDGLEIETIIPVEQIIREIEQYLRKKYQGSWNN